MKEASTVRWRKSSYSGHSGGDCVELAKSNFMIAVRDSKDPAGSVLNFSTAGWTTFARRIKHSEYDLD
ncbi:DUF397 domain-containing protein [Spirillospora sp. NPDC048911]|uniref:DUF397 domain-containing protein n=1 Tax=Spirillospora sp. NPDC048911 TaxID=3364527 RepID=UPI003715DEB9